MRQPVTHQPDGEVVLHIVGRQQRTRGELHQHAVIDEPLEPVTIGAQIRASLRMRQQQAIAAAPQRIEIALERVLQRTVRRFDEQIAAALAIADERQFLIGGAARPGEIDLAAGDDLDADLGLEQAFAQRVAALTKLARAHARMIGAHMRGCGDHAHAARSRAACQLQRRADIGCTVVDAGQDVAMHIDEPIVDCAMRAVGHKSRCFPDQSIANRSCADRGLVAAARAGRTHRTVTRCEA